MKKQTIEKIIEYFNNNEEIFNTCIEELDAYNGYLNDDRYYLMEELNEFYHGTDPIELLRRAYYGRDDDTWHTDGRGEKIYGEFNPNREFFYFNGYGNLVSSNYKDYSTHLDEYAINAMSENRQYIDTIDDNDELKKLFDELENGGEKSAFDVYCESCKNCRECKYHSRATIDECRKAYENDAAALPDFTSADAFFCETD